MSFSTGLANNSIRINGKKKTIENLIRPFAKKLCEAVEYAALASIYSAETTATELTTAQTIVLSLFYGLLFGDVSLCRSVLQLEVDQLRSTFLRIWLVDDFHFSRHDVAMVLSMMSYLLETEKLLIPEHVLRIFGCLVERYRVADCCSERLLKALDTERYNQLHQHRATKKDETERTCAKDDPNEASSSEKFRNEVIDSIDTLNNIKSYFKPVGKVEFRWLFERNEGYNNLQLQKTDHEEYIIVSQEDRSEDGNKSDTPVENTDEDRQPNPAGNFGEGDVKTTCPLTKKEFEKKHEKAENKSSQSFWNHVHKRSSLDSTLRTTLPELKRSDLVGNVPRQSLVVDEEGRTLLHRLAQFGRTEALRQLLDEGVDLEVPDYSGKTALHWAAQYNHWETVRLLLERGAQPNARDQDGRTPLSLASFKNGSVTRTWTVISEHGGTV